MYIFVCRINLYNNIINIKLYITTVHREGLWMLASSINLPCGLWFQNLKKLSPKKLDFCKILKIHEKILLMPRTVFVYVFILYKEKRLQVKN